MPRDVSGPSGATSLFGRNTPGDAPTMRGPSPLPDREIHRPLLTLPGLVKFNADLRNARARELEEKRINKELANIRFVCSPPSTARANAVQPEV
jgi:hypothetical protein